MEKELLSFLPMKILFELRDIQNLEEIRIRIKKKVLLKYIDKEVFLNFKITSLDMDEILEGIFKGSRYSYQNEIINGFITVEGGHRIGLTGSVVYDKGKIINISNISSLNIRIAKMVQGASKVLDNFIIKDLILQNTLIVSVPGQGKTTILKDLIRRLSDGEIEGIKSKTVGVVDERMELSASFSGENQIYLGQKTDIITNASKDKGMKMLIRSMAPEVIIVDEIGTKEDIEAIKYAVTSGVKGIFTAHGDSLSNVILNPVLKELITSSLIDRIIFLSKIKKCEIEKVYENTKEGYKEIC